MPDDHDLLVKISTDMDWVKDKLSRLEQDVEELKSFKWKIVGMSTLAAFAISSLIALFSFFAG